MKIYYDHATRNVTIRATPRAETVPTVEQAATVVQPAQIPPATCRLRHNRRRRRRVQRPRRSPLGDRGRKRTPDGQRLTVPRPAAADHQLSAVTRRHTQLSR
ncbi:hypothetical protein KUTG_02423 [Kutzneria sp. 744]|nr:hypothetical protein KUTG_02423 [Kutzneria sp. 744]